MSDGVVVRLVLLDLLINTDGDGHSRSHTKNLQRAVLQRIPREHVKGHLLGRLDKIASKLQTPVSKKLLDGHTSRVRHGVHLFCQTLLQVRLELSCDLVQPPQVLAVVIKNTKGSEKTDKHSNPRHTHLQLLNRLGIDQVLQLGRLERVERVLVDGCVSRVDPTGEPIGEKTHEEKKKEVRTLRRSLT